MTSDAIGRDVFDALTKSALGFSAEAVRGLEKTPKFSVINFMAAVELFFKSRLVLEHWTLIVEKPDKAELKSFLNGAFKSVGLAESITRLRNVANEILSKDEEQCFAELREHRNRLVHFVHEAYGDSPNVSQLEAIAAEQCRAWYYLRRLLLDRWAPHYASHAKPIEQIQKLIAKNKQFLKGKYAALKPEILEAIKRGERYEHCPACVFRSAHVTEDEKPLFAVRCAVCEKRADRLEVACPDCATTVYVYDAGEGECTKCGFRISPKWLVERFGPWEDPKEDPLTAYCTTCETLDVRTVIPFGSTPRFLCLACLDEHARIEQCEWCGESMAGLGEGSYYFGCIMCEGRAGHDTD